MLGTVAQNCQILSIHQNNSFRYRKYIPYARHYNPRFVYFLPTFEVQKRFFKGIFLKILALCMVSILIKNGL